MQSLINNKRRFMLLTAASAGKSASQSRPQREQSRQKSATSCNRKPTALEESRDMRSQTEEQERERYLARRRKEERAQAALRARRSRELAEMREQAYQERPQHLDEQQVGPGAYQQVDIEHHAKSLNIVLRDIVKKLYQLQLKRRFSNIAATAYHNQVNHDARGESIVGKQNYQATGGDEDEVKFLVWQKAIDQANQMFFSLPNETQGLAKQMSVVMLSINDLPASLHCAAQKNLHLLLEACTDSLEQLLLDLVDQFAEAVQLVTDQGFNVLKSATGQSSHFFKKHTLFRSSTQIHFFTHCLLQIGQAYSNLRLGRDSKAAKASVKRTAADDSSLKVFCELLVSTLIEKAFNHSDQDENSSYMNLLSLITADLALMLHCVNLEAPISIKACKILALQLMHMLCGQEAKAVSNLDVGKQVLLVDLTSDLLVSCQLAEDLVCSLRISLQQCYCGDGPSRTKRSSKHDREILQCNGSSCRQSESQFHTSCVNQVHCHQQLSVKKTKWVCAQCETESTEILAKLRAFYKQYQSNYCDFSNAERVVVSALLATGTGLKNRGRSRFQKSQTGDCNSSSDEDCVSGDSESESQGDGKGKSWLMRNVTFCVDYAKALLLQLNHLTELPDLLKGLKDTLIFVACTSKAATIRAKAMKSISKVIKFHPERALLDDTIFKLIQVRAADVSVVARESALEMLSQFFKRSADEAISTENMSKFTTMYLRLIIERASDKSHMVRKKVIHILSSILNLTDGMQGQADSSAIETGQQASGRDTMISVLKVLLLKWHDSSVLVKHNLVRCLGQILIQKLKTPQTGIDDALAFIGMLVSCTPIPRPQHQMSKAFIEIDVWTQVFAETDVHHKFEKYGDELAQGCVLRICKADSAVRKLEGIRILQTISRLIAKSLVQPLQILIPHLELGPPSDDDKTRHELQAPTTTANQQRLLCEAVLPVIEAAYSEEDGDGLPVKQSEELRVQSQRLLYSCPLVNLPTCVKLANQLDQPQLLQTILHCLNMLQTNLHGSSERVIGRALLIIAYGVTSLPQEGIEAMEAAINISIESQVHACFDSVMRTYFFTQEASRAQGMGSLDRAELFDILLEGLSQVWLTYPAAIQKSLSEDADSTIFHLITQKLLEAGEKSSKDTVLKPQTKAQIIVTFTRFLSAQTAQSQNQELVSDHRSYKQLVSLLQPLTSLIASAHLESRVAATDLFIEMHNQGHLQLNEAIKQLIALQIDSSSEIRCNALSCLNPIIRSKLRYLTASCLHQPFEIVKSCYDHFKSTQVADSRTSGFVQSLQLGNSVLIEEERGILEPLMLLLSAEDHSTVTSFIVQLLSLSDSPLLTQAKHVDLITFYSQLLLTLTKHCKIASTAKTASSASALNYQDSNFTSFQLAKGNQEKENEKVRRHCERLVQTRELAVYTKVKRICSQEATSLMKVQDLVDAGDHSEEQLSSLKEAYLVIVLKAFLRLLQKTQKTQISDNSAFYRIVSKEFAMLAELDLTEEQLLDSRSSLAERLRLQLRQMLKSRDLALKTQLEKRINAIKTQPAIKRGASSSRTESGGPELSAASAKRIKGAKSQQRESERRSTTAQKVKRTSVKNNGSRNKRQSSSSLSSDEDNDRSYNEEEEESKEASQK